MGDLASLEAMGVASVKLEGRMKRPEYVAAVTGVYRKALDTGRVSREQMNDLYRAFNRQGLHRWLLRRPHRAGNVRHPGGYQGRYRPG